MTAVELDRALALLRAVARDRATSVVPVPGGEVVLHRDLPLAHDHNRVLVHGPCDPTALADAVERVVRAAGLGHRLVEVHDAAALPDGLPGHTSSQELVMAAGPVPDTGEPVDLLDLDERARAGTATWRGDNPDWDEELLRQLGERIRTAPAAADTTFLAVRDPSGTVVARADLYVRDGVGQVEDVNTDPASRGRGLASRLVLEGVRRARAAGADLVFLVADADDWPQHLYRRLGFTDLGAYRVLRADAPS